LTREDVFFFFMKFSKYVPIWSIGEGPKLEEAGPLIYDWEKVGLIGPYMLIVAAAEALVF
jgi:hypothetical protein